MSTFTTRVSKLVRADFDFGLDKYPIFDEDYREGLNKKILDHYWNYEIGQETESMFHFSLNRKMNEIMPIYNQLYLSTQVEFDPLQTVRINDMTRTTDKRNGDVTTEASNTNEATESSAGETTSDTIGRSRSVSSTTPQVQLSGDEDYASNAADVNSDSAVTGNSQNNSKSDSSEKLSGKSSHSDTGTGIIDHTVSGSQGIASDLLQRYRATFLNIDMQIIHELETLFMQIWDNGDSFTGNSNRMNWGYGYGISGF